MKKTEMIRYVCYAFVTVTLTVVLVAAAFKEISTVCNIGEMTIGKIIIGLLLVAGVAGAIAILLLGLMQDIKFWKMIDHNQEKQRDAGKDTDAKK